MIIRDDRIVAAGALLPLAETSIHTERFGTRHRAALGITEQTDAVVVVVSEENGQISLVERARIVRNLTEGGLARAIQGLLDPAGGRRTAWTWRIGESGMGGRSPRIRELGRFVGSSPAAAVATPAAVATRSEREHRPRDPKRGRPSAATAQPSTRGAAAPLPADPRRPAPMMPSTRARPDRPRPPMHDRADYRTMTTTERTISCPIPCQPADVRGRDAGAATLPSRWTGPDMPTARRGDATPKASTAALEGEPITTTAVRAPR